MADAEAARETLRDVEAVAERVALAVGDADAEDGGASEPLAARDSDADRESVIEAVADNRPTGERDSEAEAERELVAEIEHEAEVFDRDNEVDLLGEADVVEARDADADTVTERVATKVALGEIEGVCALAHTAETATTIQIRCAHPHAAGRRRGTRRCIALWSRKKPFSTPKTP